MVRQSTTGPPGGLDGDASLRLLRRAHRGDQEALSQLLGRYQTRILRVVRRRIGRGLRRSVESEDIVQEVMVETLRSIRDFTPRDERAFLRWLAAIVENRIRYLARTQERRAVSAADEEDVENVARDGSNDRTESLERERDRLALALERISPDHRRVIHLRHYARLSFREIATELGRTEDAAWMLHKRAKVELAAEMSRSRHVRSTRE